MSTHDHPATTGDDQPTAPPPARIPPYPPIPPIPPPPWWRDENAAYNRAMITRVVGLYSIAGFAAGAVWLGLQQQWPACAAGAALAALYAAEMYLPTGLVFRVRHRPSHPFYPAPRGPWGIE